LLESGDRRNSPSYAPARIVLDHGEGVWLYDREGNKYLDFVAGIAVNCLGYNHPKLTAALREQVGRVMHVSNLFYSAEQIALMDALCARSFADRVFLCNSGAEANEAAMKLARRYQKVVAEKPEKFRIVSMLKSFHGRTMGAITATGQPKYHKGFEPLVPGFDYAEFNNLEDVASKVGPDTAAVLVEPIQGEAGVRPADPEFLRGLREICDANGALLIFDEVQTGVGRTGSFFAYEGYGVTPDIVCLAKGLGGGTPIGAMLSSNAIFEGWTRGSHATTFGGNPLVCRAGCTVLEVIDEEGLVANAEARGEQLRQGLEALAERFEIVGEVRGRGLMLGAECGDAAPAIVAECRRQGLFINTAGGNTLRFVPPLIITEDDVDEALRRLEKALEMLANA
jgi:predicted acetylornithine/succinylornithine family transaminase